LLKIFFVIIYIFQLFLYKDNYILSTYNLVLFPYIIIWVNQW